MNLDSFPAIIFKNCPIYNYTSCRNVVTVPLLSRRIPVFLFENVKPMTTTIIILITTASFVFFMTIGLIKRRWHTMSFQCEQFK